MDQTKEKTVFNVINLNKNGEAMDPGHILSYETTLALVKRIGLNRLVAVSHSSLSKEASA